MITDTSLYPATTQDQQIDLETSQRTPTDMEYASTRIEKIAAWEIRKKWRTRLQFGSAFTLGAVFGTMTPALLNEMTAKIYDFSVPIIIKQIPIFFSAATVGIFGLVAFPIFLSTHCKCRKNQSEDCCVIYAS